MSMSFYHRVDSIGGYDLLVFYDVTAFSILSANIGPAINGWEYFTFRLGPFSNCGGGCPSGLVKTGGDRRYQQRRQSSAHRSTATRRRRGDNDFPYYPLTIDPGLVYPVKFSGGTAATTASRPSAAIRCWSTSASSIPRLFCGMKRMTLISLKPPATSALACRIPAWTETKISRCAASHSITDRFASSPMTLSTRAEISI